MTRGGDSRSLFVVQRAFRRVRRGYDPEEVDRHLQLVSEWFSQGRAGRTAREVEQELLARERAAAEAEAEARAEGERIVAAARAEGERVLEATRAGAQAAADTLRADRERELAAYVERRRREADRLVEGARRARFGAPDEA
jgi:DivIVA domain-containing protein